MKITVITLCKNEEIILPFFLRHYLQFSDEIIIHDNQSTDKSREIIKSYPKTKIIDYNSGGVMKDSLHLEIKNNYYKIIDSDWFIVCDIDEFVYHKDVRKYLEICDERDITFPQIIGYQMIGDKVPEDDGKILLTEIIKTGSRYRNYDKRIVFKKCVDVNFVHGCHRCFPKGKVKSDYSPEILLLHYKMLSLDYVIKKAENVILSEENKKKGWGWQAADIKTMISEYNYHKDNMYGVI